jgi:hypothetical protein
VIHTAIIAVSRQKSKNFFEKNKKEYFRGLSHILKSGNSSEDRRKYLRVKPVKICSEKGLENTYGSGNGIQPAGAASAQDL